MSLKIVHTNTKANTKHAELNGIVTIGEATAARLNSKYGNKYKVGDQVDLGTIAFYDENPVKTWWENLKIRRRKTVFS